MMKSYDNKPTSSASAAASDERISVVKLSKSGGCVDRDAAFMKGVRESQIRSYFFGNPIPSTASSTTNVTLSPHAQQLDFNSMAVYNVALASEHEDEDDDDYDPSQLDSFLPGGSGIEDTQQQQQQDTSPTPLPGIITSTTASASIPPPSISQANDPTNLNPNIPFKKVLPPAPTALANSLLAITHAPPTATPAEVRDASIMGFLYVAEVDAEKGKVRVLAPVGGRVPPRAVVWGRKWPGEVVGLVG